MTVSFMNREFNDPNELGSFLQKELINQPIIYQFALSNFVQVGYLDSVVNQFLNMTVKHVTKDSTYETNEVISLSDIMTGSVSIKTLLGDICQVN